MKRIVIMVLLVGGAMGLKAQLLAGFFDQGAEQVKIDGQQVAALEAYGGELEQGYRIVEGGVADMGMATGIEYSLHEDYFASLTAVNPAVVGMPQVQAILKGQVETLTSLSAGLIRWRGSGALTNAEMDALNGFDQAINDHSTQVVQALSDLVTADELTMTDDQRIAGVQRIWAETRVVYGEVFDLITRTDLLVQQRLVEAGEGKALGRLYNVR